LNDAFSSSVRPSYYEDASTVKGGVGSLVAPMLPQASRVIAGRLALRTSAQRRRRGRGPLDGYLPASAFRASTRFLMPSQYTSSSFWIRASILLEKAIPKDGGTIIGNPGSPGSPPCHQCVAPLSSNSLRTSCGARMTACHASIPWACLISSL